MPLHQNQDGTWQWGKSGKKYKKKEDAVKQMKAIFANGYVEKHASYTNVLNIIKRASGESTLKQKVEAERNFGMPYRLIQDNTTGSKTEGYQFPTTTFTFDGKPVKSLGVISLPRTPLTFPRAIFRPGETGSDALRRLENFTQRARKKAGGVEYQPGVYDIPIPWLKPTFKDWYFRQEGRHLLREKIDNILLRLRGIDSHVQDNTGFYHITETPERAYASSKYAPGVLSLEAIRSGGGTVMHENTGHDFTRTYPHLGTNNPDAALNPYFLFGDAAQTFNDKRSQNVSKGLSLFPGVPQRYFPIIYQNSIPEFLAAARLQKQLLAAGHGIVSTGINPDLSDRNLPDGTTPFNKAMVDSGMWRINPVYEGWVEGDNYKRKYIINTDFLSNLHNEQNPQVNPAGDVKGRLQDENTKILKHINFMQYLLDLGQRRTPQQEKALRLYKQRLPYLLQTARNQRHPSRYRQNERMVG